MQLQNSTKDQLRAIVARIERLEEEKAALAADQSSAQAYVTLGIRKQDENKRREEVAVLDTYLHALGMAEAEAA